MRVRDEFKERIGDVLFGVVTRFEKGDIVIDFSRAEGVLGRNDRVPTEDYQIGDHICCVLVDVNINRPGPVLVVSRSAPELVKRLFEREVSEIAEGIVEIRAVAREPGFRSKIAVHSNDSKVDPVGACVGLRGSRVKTIVRELSGEKVDIIRWDADIRTYVKNALQPAELKGLQLDEATQTVKVHVEPDQLSLAIGRRGQNARLTHKLTGWKIDIEREEEKQEATLEQKMAQAVTELAATLGADFPPDVAQTLVDNGFLSAEGIRVADQADLESIEGIDAALAERIKTKVGE
jgi:N utilization substance protein A